MVSTLNQHSFTNQPPNPWIGRSIGDASRYRLEQRLGSGGMGEVFIATDTRLGKPVALKLLKESLAIADDTDLRDRFERECSICAALKSSHIIQVTDYGVTSEGYPFYVMEYLQGQTLGEVLEIQPRLPIDRTCNIMTQVCAGLQLAHEGVILWSAETGSSERIKVIHRDLKPANLMLIPSALGELVKIIDFGIAKIRSLKNEAANTTTMFLGTCHYASPEQFNVLGNVDERADIYSLGMMLYEMLTGVDPFGFNFRQHRVSNEAWLTAHVRTVPRSLRSQPDCDHIPADLEAIVLRCLEKKATDRFSSVAEFNEALQAFSTGAPVNPLPRAFAPDFGTADATYRWQPEEQEQAAEISAPQPAASLRPSYNWLTWGSSIAMTIAIAVSLPHLFQSSSSPTDPIVSQTVQPQTAQPQTLQQSQFSLNTHQISLVKTLSENRDPSKPIWAAVLSPDDRTLISGGEDQDPFDDRFVPVKIWNLSTAEVPNTLNNGHTAPIRCLSLSQDGRILASGSADNTIKIWDMATGQLLRTLQGHKAPVWSVALSRDGKTLVSGSQDQTIKIWDVESGQARHTLTEHTDIVYSVALSPDEQTIVSGSQDFTVKIWNATTGELIRTLSQPEGHRNTVRAVAISPDGTQIASASWEKNVKLWDLRTGKLLRTLEGHTDKVVTVAFINNQTLVSGSLDRTLRIWDTQSEQVQAIKDAHADWVLSVAVRADQTLVSTGSDKTIKIWKWTKASSQ
jgi:eukaryotic-like serine/threonine-protein kinase